MRKLLSILLVTVAVLALLAGAWTFGRKPFLTGGYLPIDGAGGGPLRKKHNLSTTPVLKVKGNDMLNGKILLHKAYNSNEPLSNADFSAAIYDYNSTNNSGFGDRYIHNLPVAITKVTPSGTILEWSGTNPFSYNVPAGNGPTDYWVTVYLFARDNGRNTNGSAVVYHVIYTP